MWRENEYAWFKFEKGNLSKYARQRWRTLNLIDIDQVKNIIFLDKIQKGLVVLVVLRINEFLEISPSLAFQARAITGRILCMQWC